MNPADVDHLIDLLATTSPRIQAEIFSVLCSHQKTAKRLLDAMVDDEALAYQVPPGVVARLRTHADANVRRQVRELFGAETSTKLSHVLQEYSAALHLEGDVDAGRVVFSSRCATCHRVAGVGSQVGPDIADTYDKTKEQILASILDPNQAIDGSYVAYTVVTVTGKTYVGVLAAETEDAVELLVEEGRTIVVPREDVQLMEPLQRSLMPSGFERTIDHQQMADLIAFLKRWRYAQQSE